MRNNKTYKSFDDLEKDLEILRLQKELSLRKVVAAGEHTAEVFAPSNLMKSGVSFLSSSLMGRTSWSGIIYSFLIKKLVDKVLKR